MPERNIPFGKPMVGEAEIAEVVRVMSGTTYVHGPSTKAFEEAFAERAGAAAAISVSSCTAGLHLSLFAHGVGPGDRVAVPAMTHVATAHVVEHCNAEPVFIDVEPDSGNMAPDQLDDAGALRAIMPVHYLGLPCDMDRILATAARHGAIIVEDCALAIDATWDGRKAGTIGTTGSFSFYPVKHMTTLEGGMVTTNDLALAEALRQRKAFGYDRALGQRAKPGIYDVTTLGYNYRMNEVEAAVGLAQLARLDEFQARRAANFDALHQTLRDIDEVTVFAPRRGKAISSHYCLNAVLPRDGSLDRDAVVAELRATGVGTSVHYPSAVPLFTYYRDKYGYRPGQFPVAEWLAAQTISLPVGPHLQDDDPQWIGARVKDAIAQVKKNA